MIYREAGQFKTSYAADQAVFPIVQDRVVVAAFLVVAFALPPELANEYWLQAVLIPFVVFGMIAKNLVRGRIGRSWMAIRDRDIAAEIIGVRPLRTKLLAFAISSF